MSSRSWGFKSPSGQEYINPSSAQDLCASPMKEKRLSRFSTSDFFVNYIFKFLDTLIAIKKYSGLEPRSERRAGARKRRQGRRRKRAQASRRGRIGSTYPKGFKSPAQKSRASPMKEKRLSRFSTLDLKEQIRAVRRIYVRLLSHGATQALLRVSS